METPITYLDPVINSYDFIKINKDKEYDGSKTKIHYPPAALKLPTNIEELQAKIKSAKQMISALEREKETLESGAGEIKKKHKIARLFSTIFIFTGVASIINEAWAEIAYNSENNKLILSTLVIDLSLLLITAITGFVWYRYNRAKQKRNHLTLQLEGQLDFKKFISSLKKFKQERSIENREAVWTCHRELMTETQKLFPKEMLTEFLKLEREETPLETVNSLFEFKNKVDDVAVDFNY